MAAFQSGNTAQISPRQPPFSNQGSNAAGNAGISSPAGIASNASVQQWPPQGPGNPQQRGHSLQQHNPMLSAQLQVSRNQTFHHTKNNEQNVTYLLI